MPPILTSSLSGGGGGINSIQRGTVTGTSTVTISAVDVDKTFVNVSFTSAGSTEQSQSTSRQIQPNIPNNPGSPLYSRTSATQAIGFGRGFGYGKVGGRAVLTNSTTLDVTAIDSNTTTYYEVIEYA